MFACINNDALQICDIFYVFDIFNLGKPCVFFAFTILKDNIHGNKNKTFHIDSLRSSIDLEKMNLNLDMSICSMSGLSMMRQKISYCD